jgi:hypothetical protein
LSKKYSLLCTLLGFSIPVFGYWSTGFKTISGILIAIFIFWMIAQWRGWSWLYPFVLLIGVAVNAAGTWMGISPILLILSSILLLLAWDFSNYTLFMQLGDSNDQIRDTERFHLTNITVYLVLSACMSLLSIAIHLKTSFIIAVLLVILSIAGIFQTTRWLQRSR